MLKPSRKHFIFLPAALLAVALTACTGADTSVAIKAAQPEPSPTSASPGPPPEPSPTPAAGAIAATPSAPEATSGPALLATQTPTTTGAVVSTPAAPTATSRAAPLATQTPAPDASIALDTERPNFRLLISDDRNAIDDFEHLWVTIDRIGLQQGGESGGWLEIEVPEDRRVVDLVALQGDAAAELVGASTPPGIYSKVFIHVDEVSGELHSGTTTSLKLPSGKLQIVKPFEITEDSLTTVVFDITVVAAGNERAGIKYILKPVIGKSGANQPFTLVDGRGRPAKAGKKGELTLRLLESPEPGATSTLEVTYPDRKPAPGAQVTVNNAAVGITDAAGLLSFVVPDDVDGLEIKAEVDNLAGDLEIVVGGGERRTGLPADAPGDGRGPSTRGGEPEDVSGAELVLRLLETPEAGATSTLEVTYPDGEPAPGAEVTVNDADVGTTDTAGLLSFAVPEDIDELKINAEVSDLKGKLEIDIGGERQTGPPADTPGDDRGSQTKGGKPTDVPDSELLLRLLETPEAGTTATLEVTYPDGRPAPGAQVTVNGVVVGASDAQGLVSFVVPEDIDELKINAEVDNLAGDLEIELGGGER